jgi:tagaturonate reductase
MENQPKPDLPIKILQFGEGNFIRAFVDWLVDNLNEKASYNSGVAVIQPIDKGLVEILSDQDCLYHHLIQGLENGQKVDDIRLITCIKKAINPFKNEESFYALGTSSEVKLIFSNTTEAGIAFDEFDFPSDNLSKTFPGKLVQLLQLRFEKLGNTPQSELAIIPCELIESNGDRLKTCIEQYINLWELGKNFNSWVNQRVHFANTLVDRIVPGYPKDEIESIRPRIGFDDRLVVKSESFHFFVIEGDEFIQSNFPAHKHGFNVKYVKSIVPYRTQKVRILNGAHTCMVPIGLLAGIETVRDVVEDVQIGNFIRATIYDEIIDTIQIPDGNPVEFAEQVLSRFQNPYIRHELTSISLNSISKWKVRILPTVIDYVSKNGQLPKRLTFSLACLIKFYLSEEFQIKDDQKVLDFFDSLKSDPAEQIVHKVLSNHNFWDQDLTAIKGMLKAITNYYKEISASSIRSVLINI